MRDIYILSTIVFLWSTSVVAQQEQFLQANNAYNASDHRLSIELYEQILAKGDESADLYLNLGNAYFKTEELGKAILNYERGLKIDNDHEQLHQNLEYANKRVQVPITAIPDFFLSRYWHFIVFSFSSLGWAALQLVALMLITIAAGYWLLSKELKTKKMAFYSMLFLIFIFLLSIIAGAQKYGSERNANHGVVTADKSALLTGASSQSETLLDLSKGVKVKLLDRIEDFYKVQLLDKEIGWISINDVETI